MNESSAYVSGCGDERSWNRGERERETLAPGHNFPVLSPNSHSQRRRAFKLQAYLYKRSTPVIKILVHVPSFKRRLDIIIARYIRYNPPELTKGGGRGSSSPLTLCAYAEKRLTFLWAGIEERRPNEFRERLHFTIVPLLLSTSSSSVPSLGIRFSFSRREKIIFPSNSRLEELSLTR